ncbi:MAG: hypothetical protein Q8S21_00730 [Candidatus Paracaedibacteraceae bacterium]|nr:hypothetical protein [Candidatus Paracaedibacteraceae bacterium]
MKNNKFAIITMASIFVSGMCCSVKAMDATGDDVGDRFKQIQLNNETFLTPDTKGSIEERMVKALNTARIDEKVYEKYPHNPRVDTKIFNQIQKSFRNSLILQMKSERKSILDDLKLAKERFESKEANAAELEAAEVRIQAARIREQQLAGREQELLSREQELIVELNTLQEQKILDEQEIATKEEELQRKQSELEIKRLELNSANENNIEATASVAMLSEHLSLLDEEILNLHNKLNKKASEETLVYKELNELKNDNKVLAVYRSYVMNSEENTTLPVSAPKASAVDSSKAKAETSIVDDASVSASAGTSNANDAAAAKALKMQALKDKMNKKPDFRKNIDQQQNNS